MSDLCAALLPVTPAAVAADMLRADPLYHRLQSHQIEPALADALRDGRELAQRIAASHPGSDPREIARRCNLPVEDTWEDCRIGDTWQFAEYQTRPPRIRIYRRALPPLEDYLDASGLRSAWHAPDLCTVFIAHELFHHFDALTPCERFRRHRAQVLSLGRWRWTSGLQALPEIAAGAFAQALLGLAFHPGVLDRVLRRAVDARPIE